MQVNITNTNGILAELRAQRNEALDKVAIANGSMAELKAALDAAQKRIAELEAGTKPGDVPVAEAKPVKKAA